MKLYYKHPTKPIYYKLHNSIIEAYSNVKKYNVTSLPDGAIKCHRNDFNSVKNMYYMSKRFTWFYNGEEYETCKVEEADIDDVYYRLLFHDNMVWRGYVRYDDKVWMKSMIKGYKKWTHVKNVQGVRKIIK